MELNGSIIMLSIFQFPTRRIFSVYAHALHDSVCADQRTLLSKSNSTVSYIYTGAGGEEATITFTKSDCP